MRRKDREITDRQQINAIIEACDCCRIAFPAEDAPYIVPLNFGYIDDQNKRTLYFHGAKEGRKIDLINKTDYVGFEMDTNHTPVTAEGTPCSYTFLYSSIIGKGKISLIDKMDEKIEALKIITRHINPNEKGDISPESAAMVSVFKIEVDELSCKEHI